MTRLTGFLQRRRRGRLPPLETFPGAAHAAQTLRATEAGFAATIDAVRDAVVTIDADGCVTRMNPEAERLSEWTLDAALGRPVATVLPLFDQADGAPGPAIDADARQLGLLVDATDRVSLGQRGGGRVPVAVTCSPTGAGAVVVVRDVTAERRADARLDVGERLVALDALAEGLAHEINNPLAAVDANAAYLTSRLASLAERYPDEPLDPLLAAAAEIRCEAARVAKAVATLQALQQPDVSDAVALDVREVLDAALDVAGNALRHRARVVRDFAPAPLRVVAPRRALEQACLALLLNAAEAIPEGAAGDHQVRVRCCTDAVGQVEIIVRDSGCGIDPLHLPRIFDPFFSGRPPGESSGLGLALARGTVTALGGHLSAESELGAGATFRLCLPRAPAGASSKRPAPIRPPTTARARRVLAIDDERPVLRALRRLLGDDRDVECVSSGAAALERLTDPETPPYDVVVCDVMMPEMSGIQLHAAVAERAPDYLDRLVFMTGGAFTQGARNFLAEVDNRCISKPFDLQELESVFG